MNPRRLFSLSTITFATCFALSGCRAGRPSAPAVQTPYSASELARAHPVGTYMEHRIEAIAQDPKIQRTEWLKSDQNGYQISRTVMDLDRNVIGRRGLTEASWKEFESLASFTGDGVTVAEERISTEAGAFDCLRYEHVTETEGTVEVTRYWFDRNRAGEPVRLEYQIDGQEVMRMDLVDTNRREH